MLDYSTYDQASILAQGLAQQKVQLRVKPNTPLADLMAATYNYEAPKPLDPMTGVIPEIVAVNARLNGEESGITQEHSARQDEIVQVCAGAIKKDLYVAQSLVVPAIEEIVKYVTDKISKLTPNELLGLEIVIWNPPKPMATGSISRMVDRFENTPFVEAKIGMKLPSRTYAEITELIKTKIGDLDSDVAEWLATKDEAWVETLYEKVFGNYQVGQYESAPTLPGLLNDPDHGYDASVFIFLMASGLYDNPFEGVDCSLSDWNQFMDALINSVGKRILVQLEGLDSLRRSKHIVRTVNRNSIVVFEPAYRDWLENGGDNDVMLGGILADPGNRDADKFDQKRAEFRDGWRAHELRMKTIGEINLVNETRVALVEAFRAQLLALAEEDRAGLLVPPARIQEHWDTLVRNLPALEFKNLNIAVLRLLCATRFANTNAEEILIGIEEARQLPGAPSGMTLREAASISTTRFITRWLFSQCDVVRI